MKPLYYSCIKNGVIVVLALFAIQATQAFVLEIKTGKLVYALAEPVVLYVSVKNMDDELAQLPAHLGPDFQEVNYAISEVSGGDKLFVPWIRKDSWEPVRNFASGEVREEEVKLFFSAQGWAYPTPGTYTITAEFAGQSSNPLTITVGNAAPATLRTADGDDAEAAAQLLLHSGQAGFFLLFEGGPHLTKGIEILEQIVADYPNTPHAAYARTALGNHQREQGNYQEALALLNAAKAQPAGFYNTVHTHAFLYRTHMAAENAEEAQAVFDSLEETVSEQFSELASFADAVFRDNGVPLEDAIHCISGQILDNTGNPLADAAVRVSGYPQTAVADESGQYQIDGLRPGAYALSAKKEGYLFEPGQANITGNGACAEVNFTSFIEPPRPQPMLLTAIQSCDGAGVVFSGFDGQETHRFDTEDAGIYLDAADLDGDGVTDIAITEIGKGDDVLMLDAAGGETGAILTDIGKSGIRAAFADLDKDGVFEAVIAKRAATDRVYIYRLDGTLVRELKVFNNAAEFDLAAGDVNGDGRDEIILAAAAGINGDTVFIFNGEGGLMQSFAASPGGALRVITADVNADGADEIIVGEAAGYAVAVYTADGTQISAFDVFGESEGSPFPFLRTAVPHAGETGKKAGDKISICHMPPGNPGNAHTLSVSASALPAHLGHGDHEGNCESGAGCSLYQGPGTVLTSGDINGDGRAEIIVAKAGEREVRVYTAEGGLQIAHFEAAGEDSVITDAAFASNILISPSLAGALPNTGKLLENAAAGINLAEPATEVEEITVTNIVSGDWQIRELYSNEDGSAQFIELYYNGSDAVSLKGARLLACDNSNPGGCPQVCDDNSPNCALFDKFANSNTAESGRRHVLFATPSFEALPGGGSIKTEEQELDANGNPASDADGNPAFKFKLLPSRGVKPDYEIPFNFLFAEGGHVELFLAGEGSAAAQFTYSKLPINGLCSLHSGDANVKEDPACSKYAAAAGQTAGALQPLLVSRNFPVNSANEEGTVSNGHSHAIYDPATQILKIPAIYMVQTEAIPNPPEGMIWASFFLNAETARLELLNVGIRSQPADGHYAEFAQRGEYYDKALKIHRHVISIPVVVVKETEQLPEGDITSHKFYTAKLQWIEGTDNPAQFKLFPGSGKVYPDIDIHLEFDMPDCINDLRIAQNLPWPPKTNRKGVEHTLETIFSGVGVDITIVEDLSAKRQDGRLCSDPYTDKQLHQFMDDNSSLPEGVDKTEYIHVAFLPDHVTAKGYGAMASGGMPADSTDIIPPLPPTHPDYHTWVNRNKRNSVIVFVEKFKDAQDSLPAPNDGNASTPPLPITYEEEFLRSTTHEIGHGLNLLHSDGGGESAPSIMDAAKTFAKDIKNRWSYRWSTLKAREHFLSHSLGFPDPEGYDPVNRIRPATEFGFLSCHSTKGEICPVKEAGPSACEDTR